MNLMTLEPKASHRQGPVLRFVSVSLRKSKYWQRISYTHFSLCVAVMIIQYVHVPGRACRMKPLSACIPHALILLL